LKILIAHALEKIERTTVERLREKLQEKYKAADIEIWNAVKPPTREDIKKAEADMFVDFNLFGFEQGTLAGSIVYNLLDCKQVHILLDTGLPNEKQLEKQLSIAMFFFCVDAQYGQYLAERYPELPSLQEVEGFQKTDAAADVEHNAGLLCDVVGKVLQRCRLVC